MGAMFKETRLGEAIRVAGGPAHHRLSPSSAEQWMTCPGSPEMEAPFDDETSEYSSEGTAAHTVRERCLNTGKDVADFLGEWIEADEMFFEVTNEWVHYLQPGIERIREAAGFDWVFEYRVKMDPWIPGGFGTLDAGGISAELIIIDDLKFGAGIPVDADRNKQLMIYALGFWMNYARHKTKAKRFLLRIDQPRVSGEGSEWYVTLDELLEFAEEVAAAAEATMQPNAPLQPSPKGCRFCRAARNAACHALDAYVLDLLGLSFSDLDVPVSKKLALIATDRVDPKRRAVVINNAGLIRSWLNNVQGIALSEALQGKPTPGLKPVETEGNRAWGDEERVAAFLKGKFPDKDLYTRELKSPTQMELVVGTRTWERLKGMIERPPGKPALVPESDKRPAIEPLDTLLPDLDDDGNEIIRDEIEDLI